MIPMAGGGGYSVSGGTAGPATATSSNNSGQSVGAIYMGSPQGVSPWLIGIVLVVIVFLMMKKK